MTSTPEEMRADLVLRERWEVGDFDPMESSIEVRCMGDGPTIADVLTVRLNRADPEEFLRARLIAEAPVMFAVLVNILKQHEGDFGRPHPLMDDARAVLKKVRGEK